MLTVIMRHDQALGIAEINQIQTEQEFWTKSPPERVEVESWHVVPPARLREVNRAVEQAAWKAYRVEFYPAYDVKEVARTLREQAQKK